MTPEERAAGIAGDGPAGLRLRYSIADVIRQAETEAAAKARADEREGCAVIADLESHGSCVHETCKKARRIAAAIRARKP